MPDASQNDLDGAVALAKQQFPRLANWNVKLTTGERKGDDDPRQSETYFPDDPDNPTPGTWNLQLLNPKTIADKSLWPQYVGLESLHWLQDQDPQFQNYTEQFVKSMTPQQHADARQRYTEELAQAYQQPGNVGENLKSYDNWLRKVQALEYIRGGGMFPTSSWLKDNEGGYTPDQMKLMGQITNYLKTPNPNTDPQAYQLNKLMKSGVAG